MTPDTSPSKKFNVVLGAGPSGIGCAYELSQKGISCVVVEKNAQAGGLCRTLKFDGYLFDIGGHRLLTKCHEVDQLWKKILGEDLLKVKRKSRIYYRGKYLNYPLEPINALMGLGALESLLCCLSCLYARLFKPCDDQSFEGWMINRFGKRLYEIFFKSYTEKVWAVPCSQISSDWAVQRIQGLSLGKAIKRAFSFRNRSEFKTLSEEFYYPTLGPGLFFDRLKQTTEASGVEYFLKTKFKNLYWDNNRVESIELQDSEGEKQFWNTAHLFSSIPLTLLIQKMRPEPPDRVVSAAQNLKFRSFMVVNLVFQEPDLFPDNWLYIHSSSVKVGRIQNYKNWSPFMVPDPETSSLGMEYFVTEGDSLWNMNEESMIDFALSELEKIGITSAEKFIKGFVVRVANVYPVYGPDYQSSIQVIRSFLDTFENLSVMGRSGMFRYDNSDHALLSGIYAARNYLGRNYDPWNVNTERIHHEEYESTEIY